MFLRSQAWGLIRDQWREDLLEKLMRVNDEELPKVRTEMRTLEEFEDRLRAKVDRAVQLRLARGGE
jgi:hypothetical protein